MNGDLAEAVSLVSYGNTLLYGEMPPVEWTAHSAFRYVSSVSFVRCRPWWAVLSPQVVVASSIDRWFAWLRQADVESLRLAITVNRRWVIRARASQGTDVWQASMRHQRDDGTGRMWRVTYTGCRDSHRTEYRTDLDIATAATNLAEALEAAIQLSRVGALGEWVSRFADARSVLTTRRRIPDFPYHPDLLGPSSDAARRLTSATLKAWVFGGQDSWSDQPFTALPREPYKQVTRQLYGAVLDAIAAAANGGVPSRTDSP